MMEMALAPAQVAGARSALYALLAQAFAVPDAQGFARLGSVQLNEEIGHAVHALPEPFDPAALSGAWCAVREALGGCTSAAYEAEYLRTFEVGIPAAPCPLYESAYGPPDRRREVMGELVRFYNHFGLSLGGRARELPDHLRVELEFMHCLTFLEAQGALEANAMESVWRAQADFLRRHVACWTRQLWARLARQDCEPFEAWAAFAQTVLAAELEYSGRVS